MAVVSITHRISGVLVFLLIPLLLWSLNTSLASPEGMAQVQDHWRAPLMKAGVWLFFAGMIFHLFAGIRHLLMDARIGDSLSGGRSGAWAVILASLAVIIAAFGMWG